MPSGERAPRPGLREHLAVLGLLLLTVLNGLPYLLWFVVGWVGAPWLRARARRALRVPPPPPVEPPVVDAASLAGRRVFVVAGEESGDRLLAGVAIGLPAAV